MTAPISGPKYGVDATDHDYEQKQDELEERKRIRADEVCDRCEDATSDAGYCRRDSERGVADHDRIETDRNAGDLRIPYRPHRSAPSARTQLAKQEGREHRQCEHQVRDRAVGELHSEKSGRRNSGTPVPTAGQPTPFRRALFDHEAERDGYHGEVWTAYPKRRDGE